MNAGLQPMRPILLAAVLFLSACATVAPPPPATGNALAGRWRATSGQTLSISLFSSFATRQGCIVTGGMLAPIGGDRYRIDRYDEGHGTDGCGPWRSGPEIAPFDGAEVVLRRSAGTLTAEGPGGTRTYRWIGPSPV